MKILLVAGAQPNFMKIALIIDALNLESIELATAPVYIGAHRSILRRR